MAGEDNVIRNEVQWETVGTQAVIRDMDAVKDANASATKAINDANTAVGQLNTGLQQVDFAPLNTAAQDFWQPVNDANDKARKNIKETGGSMLEMGEAGQQLKGALDQAIPGLGGIFESLTAMNPVAIAGTIALTGIAAVFGEMQKKAEEARAAIEAQVKAETDRVVSQAELDQRINLAMTGNKEARESIIKDLAANQAQANLLDQERLSVQERLAEAQKTYDEQLALSIQHVSDGATGYDAIGTAARDSADKAKTAMDELNKQFDDLEGRITANNTQFEQLNEATEQLNISEAELNAVRLAGVQGTEGATTALENLWGSFEKGKDILSDVGGNVLDTFQNLGKDIAEGVDKAMQEAAKAREDAEKRLVDINEDLTQAEEERGKVLADRFVEEQRGRELSRLEDRLAAAQAYDAAVAKNKKIADIQQQAHAADIAAQQKFMENQQKLLANYIKSEQNATEDYSRERVRKLEDLYNTLNNLASQRDVAGFVNARNAGMTGINRGDEDNAVAARRRREAFDAQQADLVAAFNQENATRQAQLQQRIQQEQAAGQQQVTQASIVQKQIADLRRQYAEQDLRARRQSEDAAYRQTVTILEKKRQDELRITAGAAAGVIDFFNRIGQAATRLTSGASQAAARGGLRAYDEGTPYVTHDQVALIHRGERVMTAAENARYMRSGSGGQSMPPVTVNVSVGEHVTQTDIDMAVRGFTNALKSYGANQN